MENEERDVVQTDIDESKIDSQTELVQTEPDGKKPKNVFTNKNFCLAFLGALVSNLGSIFYSFAVSFYILEITGNNAFIQGIYLATGGFVFVIATLFGGVIGDRYHKGKIMYLCDYAKGALLLISTVLLMTVIQNDVSKVVVLFVIQVIANIIAGIFSPTAASLLPKIVPPESFQQAQSYHSILDSFMGIIGIVLAGIFYSILPINVLFIIVGVCYVLSGVSEMFIKYDYVKPTDKFTLKLAFKDIGVGFKYLVSMKPVLYLVITILFINFFLSPIFSNFIPYYIVTDIATHDYMLKNVFDPPMWNSILSVIYGISSITMAIVLSSKKQKERIIKGVRIAFVFFILDLLAFTVVYFLFTKGVVGINATIITLCIVGFIMGLIMIQINIPISTKMLTLVDQDKLGKVDSVISIGSQGLIPLSNLIAGIVISGLGSLYVLVFSISGLVIMTVMLMVNKQIAKL